MKRLIIALAMPFLIGCGMPRSNGYGNSDAVVHTTPAQKVCLEGNPGGILLCDNLSEYKWEIKNQSDTAVHLTCTVIDRKFVFIDQYYLAAQAFETVPDAGMQNGDNVICSMWLGYFAGPVKRILQSEPDISCSFTYSHTAVLKTTCAKNTIARIALPEVKGVSATLAAPYEITGTTGIAYDGLNGASIATLNNSSDYVDYQVFAATSTSATDVRVDFELCKVRMYIKSDDVCSPTAAIGQDQILVLAVHAYDVSYTKFVSSDYAIVRIDLKAQKAIPIDKTALKGGLP